MLLGPRWCSDNTLASHLWGQWFKPQTLCGQVGSFLPDGRQLIGPNLDQLYVLVSSAHKTTYHDMAVHNNDSPGIQAHNSNVILMVPA